MNTESVRAAFNIEGVSPSTSRPSLEWNSQKTEATIRNANLVYAPGDAPSANTYAVTLSSMARDLAGNSLTTPYRVDLKTYRKYSEEISPKGVYWLDSEVYRKNNYAPMRCDATAPDNNQVERRMGTGAGLGGGYLKYWALYVEFEVGSVTQLIKTGRLLSAVFKSRQAPAPGATVSTFCSPEINTPNIELTQLEDATVDRSLLCNLPGEGNLPAGDNSLCNSRPPAVTPPKAVGALCADRNEVQALSIAEAMGNAASRGAKNLIYQLNTPEDCPRSIPAYYDCSAFALKLTYLAP
jgi:hypothetical protein